MALWPENRSTGVRPPSDCMNCRFTSGSPSSKPDWKVWMYLHGRQHHRVCTQRSHLYDASHSCLGCLLSRMCRISPAERLCSASHCFNSPLGACEACFHGNAPQDAGGEVGVGGGGEAPRHHLDHRHHAAGQADLHMSSCPVQAVSFSISFARRSSSEGPMPARAPAPGDASR